MITSPRLRNYLVVFLFTVSLLPYPTAQAQVSLPQQKQEAKPEAKPVKKERDFSQEAFVIEQFKTSYRYEKEGTGQREMTLRVKMQSDAGVERFGQLVFPYNSANEKLNIELVRVLKSDGSAVNASDSNVQDLSAPLARQAPIYTDVRQKHVTVPGLRPGDVLEYRVVWLLETPFAPNHFWLNHTFIGKALIVLDEQLEVNIPLDSKVKLKIEPGFDPVIKEKDGRRNYSWKQANLKREEEDDDEAAARKKRRDADDPKPPPVQMTTFQSWDEVGQWYAGLERDRIVPDDKIRAKAESLIQGLSSDKEKVAALYHYVAKNFRYVSLSLGQGRYQPHAAADVLANQYGDCKDKHTLLASMLTATGLRAYPALMNSSRKIDPEMPSPGQFDHVISAIPIGAETLWADTTSEVAPFQLLSPRLRDKKALLIPIGAPARLETTPAEPPFLSSEFLEIEGQVNELGKLSGHSRISMRGDGELLFRTLFRRTPKSDWKELGYYFSMMGAARGEVTEIKPSDPADTEKPFEVEYDFASDDFLDWSSKKTKLGLPIPSLRLVEAAADKEDDAKPLQLGPPIKLTYRLKLTLPAKYQTRSPLPVKVSRDYAEYSSTYKLEGNTLIAERTLHLRQRELPASRVQDYRAFVAATQADQAQALSLETSVTGSPVIPESVKVEELISAAEAAAKNENYPLVEQLLTRVLEKEPKHKTVRRQLAWSLFAQRKYEPAAKALREQTEINPFDDYSYNLLGRVFWQQQKYAEAETAFRKQLEVSPLDKWAHQNLGQMLVEWRKYKEAVPELEQAISLAPEEESLYVSIGRAYINLNQTEKAIESFEKAIMIAPGPPVWNNVSYYLAVGKVQLEKAQQYAESAATSISAALRNVEIENLTQRDLYHVTSVAAYWDTLGWVHYQRGNLEAAEKYISAAWNVGHHSEVGYHLGQILEKRGKTEEAIQMYALAAVADRSVPEPRESLDRLVDKTRSAKLIEKANEEFKELRTVKLGALLKDNKGTTEAQFFVVLIPGSSRKAEVSQVKFIAGDEKLRPLGAALKAANFNLVFPGDTMTKVIRRGTLFCQPNGECSFIMISPDYVTLD